MTRGSTTLVPRRTVLAGLLAASIAAGTAGCMAGPPVPLTLASGEPGGFYAEFAELLASAFRDSEHPLDPRPTGGSTRNIELLARGEAALGLALTDVAVAARAGQTPFGAPVELLAIGRVYENYLQLAVRAESEFRTLPDLAGRTVSLGAPGSGAGLAGQRLAAVSGIPIEARALPLTEATAALDAGALDAFLWSGGVPTPAVAALAARRPIRLIPLSGYLAPLAGRHGAYAAAVVPPGVYGSADAVATIGVANLLVGTRALPDEAATAVARVLVERAPGLVPASALGTQYLDQPALVDTGEVPLHPGAAAAYRELHG